MKVPFSLRRVGTHPAQALLLLSDQAADLLALCARLRRWPAIHAVAGGFLVRLPQPSDVPQPHTIRLRALCPNLLVPVDAELSPALLADEAEALVRRRGLVFLPGGRVLSFAPETVLRPVDLLAVARLPRRPWLPLPARPNRPERLGEVILEVPVVSAESVVAGGGEGIGTEAPRPGASGAAATAAGHAMAGLGRGLTWLGGALNWDALKKMGGELIQKGIEQAPRVSEAVLGRQQAALRELLRQFREGNLDDALRHALPLNARDGSGEGQAADANLPTHSIVYSLGGLFGGGGIASVWMTPGDVYDSLVREYRKAAEAATRRGDYRRAAFIYGKLLGEWRNAATALERGGLHHDAAILYLHKLGDLPAAARAYEAAGEIDRALELHVQADDHVAAGDLLTRAGEPERAVEFYRLGAAIAAGRGDHLAAGELMLQRARRADLAEVHFRDGWQLRSTVAASQGCLLRLLDLYSRRSPPADLLRLIDEAGDFFADSGSDVQASAFYNELARRADAEHLTDRRDDLRDRALTALAMRLRKRAASGQVGPSVVPSLLTLAGGWEPALVRDAEVAVRGHRRVQPSRPKAKRTQFRTGQVTAVCSARASGDVFVGFADGEVIRHDPVRGLVPVETRLKGRVDALSVDDEATLLVAVSHDEYGHHVASFRLGERGTAGGLGGEPFPGTALLSNVFVSGGSYLVGLWDGFDFTYLSGTDLMPEQTVSLQLDLRAAIILSSGGNQERRRTFSLLFGDDRLAFLSPSLRASIDVATQVFLRLPWRLPEVEGIAVPPFDWSRVKGHSLEMCGVTEGGALGWARLRLFEEPEVVATRQVDSDPPFLAAALLSASSLVAGVRGIGVYRYAISDDWVRPLPPIAADLREAVACFSCPRSRELIVVCRRGEVVRVAMPE